MLPSSTAKTLIFFAAYLYQKDERALPGNLRVSEIFCFTSVIIIIIIIIIISGIKQYIQTEKLQQIGQI